MNRVCARVREILEPFGAKTNTAKRVLKVLTVPLAACALMFGATSASADQVVPYSNYTVKTVNPTGTTVNLFDYWVVDGDNDKSATVDNINGGINKGHQLKFNSGAGTGINKWTGKSGTAGYGRLRFVENQLVNGYPAIKAGTYTSQGENASYTDESLAYLFNNDSQNGKAVYNNVQGLFQLENGYYVYDSYGSKGNYAVYNSTTNSFNVYDKAGVYKESVSSENLGQFFPFDSAEKVFEEQNGQLSPKPITDGTNDTLNHHFGMSMTTEFVQPTGGKTTDNKDMVFEFSGDDDVWVYIDGVLVGDLGGIHEKATLDINFATGEVRVGHIDGANGSPKYFPDTTIKAMFQAAGVDTSNFRDDTFRDSSKHKLSFFYLERGAGASNMSLKFNLTTLPSSEVEKVNQNGEAVQGATFALYQSDADWNAQGEAIARGTTDDKGQLVLLKSDGSVLSFDQEHAEKHDYFVLKEIELPEGYRSSLTSSTTATPGELHLQYKQAATGTGGVVVAPQETVTTADGKPWTGSRMWLNGGYLAAKETISLSQNKKDNKNKPISSGTTFAVVLKRTDERKKDTDENAWTPVTGNPLDGYTLCSEHGIAGAVQAAKSADTSVFAVNTKGDYEVTVRSLPGDIEKYAAMMEDKSKSEYTVAVYHTTASSLAEATTENTSMVEYQSTNRQFSTVIHLTNVQNRLFVQKVDDLGEPVNGATFDLYKADAVTGDSPSTYAIKPGATPYDTVQANGMTYPYEIKGAACFPLDSVNHAPLIKGTYYLRESMSPDGYELNTTITKVIVDDSGVYVDAGDEFDDVRSMSGPGSLIASLAQFGSPDSIDNTLTHIKGKLQSATVDASGNLTWDQTRPAEGVMHMRYDKTAQGTRTVLRYVEDKGVRDGQLAIIYADTGINRMALYQEDDPSYIDDASKARTNLGTLQLNHLFTTATAVQYTDRRVARLQVTKTVTADNGLTAPTKDAKDNDLTFTFKFTLPESQKGYEAHVFEASGKPVGNSFRLKNGDTHSIKAGETIRVYDLKKDDNYSVSELTTKGEESSGNVLASIVNTVTGSADESVLPAGFSLVSRKAGGEEQSGTGNTIEGKIVALVDGKIPASNKLEFTNNYSASSVTLSGLSAKKVLDGRDWADGDAFTVKLTAEDGVPMPNGAKSKVSTVEFTKDTQTQTVGDITYKTATFGDITYTKPGTYIYTISEAIPGSDAGADGISYSAASYTATVMVGDNQAGALVVTSVKVVQECNDAGDDTKTEVADAIFTNRYDEHERNITIHAQKSLTDNAGTFPLAQNAFTFKLEGVGGYADVNAVFNPDTVDKSMTAPMPQGAEGNTMKVGNNADGTVTWPAISYTAKPDAGRAYVYKFAEKFAENPGSVTGMTYDESVYYAVVRNAKKGAGIQTSIEYYKVAEGGSVEQLDKDVTPLFTNTYSVEPTSVTLQGQKTVSGRDWNQGESYTFNLTAATDDDSATSLGKTTKQAVADGAVVINTNQAVASAPESGRVASFSFGTEAAPTVTFNRAGTFSFIITENVALGAPASMSMDRHTARATVVVTDLDERGNHTGKLHVSSVTYANTGASDADKGIIDKAAFTNAYHASGTFGGVTVSKTLEGRASTAGQFTFAVTGLWYNGVQTSIDGAEAKLSNKAAKAGVSGAVVGTNGTEKLFARKLTEQDLGHTFAYCIHENQPAAAGYTYDTGYTGDAIVLVKVLASENNPARLYTVATVLKGAGVTELLGDAGDVSALTDEKIAELKQKPNTYVQQYDASKASTTTPTVSFVNRYTASLDYGTAGGIQIEKTLTYPEGATVFGSPKSTFRYIAKPADEASAKKVGITMDGKVFETANVEANDPKTVSLIPEGGLKFNQNDAGKTFTYTVSEIDDKATGYTYDSTVHTVKAVVADNGDGTLKVTTSVSKKVDGKDKLEGQWIYPSDATSTGAATVKFKNTYTVTEAATYTPSVTKVVAGADAPSKFTFTMTAADEATKAAIDGKLITGSSMSADNGYVEQMQTKEGLKNGEHDKVDFSKLTFNAPGTYKFAINEAAPNSGLGEWKYDQHVYTLTVTVTDEGGKLVARADGTTGSEGFIFTNSYKTSTSYELQGGLEIVKTLEGKDLHAGMFGFTVTADADSTEYAASTEKLKALLRQEDGKLTVTNDEPQADGKSYTDILGGLTFTTNDAGKTFTYKVVENKGNKGGYTYDSTYWTVGIAVKNRDNGSLYTVTTVKHYNADGAELSAGANIYNSEKGTAEAQVSFTNNYVATGMFEGLTAEKVMDSRDKIEAGQYTFDLYAEKADGSPEKMDEGTTQASDNGIATVDFGKVDFKLGGATSAPHEQTIDLDGAVNKGIATKRHNADHTTTYSFNLVAKERLASLPDGVRPVDASATCRVLLEVTDNNDGTLTSKVTYRDGTENGKIVFHNTRDKVKTIGTVAKPSVDIDGQLLSVGDSYVYTINWVNTEADASVTVTDELPAGVVFEAFEGENADKGAASGQSLTWNLGEQPAGSHGSVRVRVKITEDAVKGAQGAVGTVNNKATVTVGNKSYTGTTTNYVPKKSESDAQDSNELGVALGDELTYTIGYKNTENVPATVTITDTVPAGTKFVEFAGDHADIATKDNDGNLTWTLTDVPAGEEGTVQFKVRVTEDAFKSGGASGDISNQASVKVGNNPAVKTNTTTDEVSDGRLTLSKTVTADEGITAPNKAFTFKVLLYQVDGTTPLAGTFVYAGRPSGTNGTYVSGQIKSGETIALKAGGSVTVTVPVGARYEVQELDSKGNLMTSEDGFAVADKTNTQKGAVGQATQVGFTNVYSVESTKVENAFKAQKKISGRNWTTTDAFTMTLTAQGEAPMPKNAKGGVATITLKKDVQVGNFGTIEYTKPGTYTYVIAEQAGDETALTFSEATYRATVTVTDDGTGKLTAKTKIAQLTDDAGSAVERTVEAAVFTNTAKTGALTVKKTVVGGDSQREFGFTVALTDGDGEPVSGTFGEGENAVTFTDGKATFTLRDGEKKAFAGLPVGARYTVTEDAVEGYTTTAEGAEGTVTEDGATAAFTNTYGTAAEGRDVSTAGLFTKTLKGRDWAEGDSFQFMLAGEGGAPMPEGSAGGSKTVSVTATAGTKAGTKVAFDFGSIRYALDDINDAGFAEVGGKRVRAKTFTYAVREVRPDDGSAIAGIAYDGRVATMTVTVTDDGSGNLTASTPAIAQASGGDFVNTYTTELDYSARAGVRLSKTLSGRAMEAGQFAFTVTADAETAAKLGLKTGKDAYAVAAADDGEAAMVDLIGGAAGGDVKFTDADAGKTYSFTVAETKLGGEGYTNDTEPRTVTIAPAYDAATGELTVTTTVVKDGVEVARSEVSTADDASSLPAPVTVAFQNSYEATGTLGGEGDVSIEAAKTLTGRAAAAGEFSFSVRDAQGNVVATASNRASGDGEAAELAFSPIAYATGSLGQMAADGTATRADDGSWTIPYTVSEDTEALPAGVTAAASNFDITVKVTDNGKGGLDVAVAYPDGSDGKLSFVNGYGTNEATVDLAGTKTLALGQAGLGLTQADIAGKYTFKVEPLDGAPAPVDASGKTVTEATNDAAGNVVLGHVAFKQPSDLDDAAIDGDGLRTKTFAYRVSESGSVDGVVNDATATRTFTVKVVEDTNAGTLAAKVLPAEGTPEGKGAFEFTNTYGVNPTPSSVTDQIKVSKKLKGRDLAEGEFEFQLVELAADGGESVAATGKNAADGTVALSPVTYTAPGMHSYELREVAGTAAGVTYDKATYRVRTTVTDAGNGTLAVKHELADAEGNPTGDDSVTFTNGYEAAPVTLKLGAAKVLKGAELEAGQFSFELESRDGKVMSTAKNAADGSVTFDALTFKQAGTYTFTVSEVDDGQAHVTYDKAVHKIVVTVSDEAADGTKTGYLSAKVSYEGDAGLPPVFTNSYAEEPGTPGTPENPGTPGGGSGGGSDNGSGSGSSGDGSKGGMPDTGDRSLPVEALGAMAGIGALAVAGGAVLYRRRR